MPFPNEHSARLRNPGDFDPDTFRRTKGGTIYGKIKVPQTVGIIWGKLKGSSAPEDMPIPQTLRFLKDSWSAAEAKVWLKTNNIKYISFEPAKMSEENFKEQVAKAFSLFESSQLMAEFFERFRIDQVVFEPTGSYTYLEEEKVGDLGSEAVPLYQELEKEGRYTKPNMVFCSVCGFSSEHPDEGVDMRCSICENTLRYGFGYLDGAPLYGFLEGDVPHKARKPIDFDDNESPFYVIKKLTDKGDIETIHVLPLFYKGDWRGEELQEFDLDVVDVLGVEIFATGTWKEDSYTEKDLDELTTNFQLLKGEIKPPVKIGHQSDGEQKKFLKGMPAIGKVVNLRRIGTKLLADFQSVPKKVADLIKAKAYDRISSEIYMRYEKGKKKYGKVLAAVALLGAEIPAVKTLKDVLALYDQNGAGIESKVYEYIIGADSDEEIQGGFDKMTDQEARMKQMEDQIAVLTKDIADSKVNLEEKDTTLEEKDQALKEKDTALEEKGKELETATTTLEEKEKELETVKTALEEAQTRETEIAEAQRISDIKLFVEEAKKEGKILPVFEGDLMDLMCRVDADEKVELTETAEDGTVSKRETTMLDLCKGIVGKFPKMVDFDELSSSGGSEDETPNLTELEEKFGVDKAKSQDLTDIELDQKATVYAEKHGVSYSKAVTAVSKGLK
jgi:hypothetical protein